MIGVSERALERMCRRLSGRVAFGKPIAEQSVWQERIAEARCAIEQARLLTLHAAWKMEREGNKAAKAEIAMIKIVAPAVTCRIVDIAMQAFGGRRRGRGPGPGVRLCASGPYRRRSGRDSAGSSPAWSCENTWTSRREARVLPPPSLSPRGVDHLPRADGAGTATT